MINNDQIGKAEETIAKLNIHSEQLTNLWFDVQRLTRVIADIGLTMREAADVIQQFFEIIQQDEELIAQLQADNKRFEDDLK